VGDYLIFTLDQSASIDHTVSWDDNSICPPLAGVEEGPCWPELRFNDENQKCSWRNYVLPRTRCILVRKPGEAFYYDKYLPRPSPNHYHGTVKVAGVPTTTSTVPPISSTTVVPPSTTTTTLPPTTATTAPTTTTTAPTSIRPMLVSDPPPVTTTTAAPKPLSTAPSKNGGASTSNAGKDKGKGKAASPETPTTAAQALPDTLPSDLIFDPASLTPGPMMIPDPSSGPDSADEAALDAAAVASLLDPLKSEDDSTHLMLLMLAALAAVLLAGGGWAWFNRASRYDPA
jgi:hypothetical protein